MKNKKIVELMLILGVTAGLAGGCTQKTKEQSYVNITKTAAENSTEQSQEYLYDERSNYNKIYSPYKDKIVFEK